MKICVRKRLTVAFLLIAILSLGALCMGMQRAFATAEEPAVVDPYVWYKFDDASNLGKDAMGKFDLATLGEVTKSDKGAHFSSSMLYAPSEEKDISESIGSYTMCFEMTPEANNARSTPIGFGWNDWAATKYSWFTIGQLNDGSPNIPLRYSTHKSTDGTDADPSKGRDWGIEILNNVDMTGATTYKIVLSFQIGGKATVYIDGVKTKYFFDIADDYNMKDPNTRFAIGASRVWNDEAREPFKGSVNDVKIYNFAFAESEVTAYNSKGQLTENDVLKVKSAPTVDFTQSVKFEDGMTDEQILKIAPATSNVKITLSDDSVVSASVSWKSVVLKESVKCLEGEIEGYKNPNNIKVYANITQVAAADVKSILPIAEYDFKNQENLGANKTGGGGL